MRGLSLRDIFEGDRDFLAFAGVIVDEVIDRRAAEAQKRPSNG